MSRNHKQRAYDASALLMKLLAKRIGPNSLLRPKAIDRRDVYRHADFFISQYGAEKAIEYLRIIIERHARAGDSMTVAFGEDVLEAVEQIGQCSAQAVRWRV